MKQADFVQHGYYHDWVNYPLWQRAREAMLERVRGARLTYRAARRVGLPRPTAARLAKEELWSRESTSWLRE